MLDSCRICELCQKKIAAHVRDVLIGVARYEKLNVRRLSLMLALLLMYSQLHSSTYIHRAAGCIDRDGDTINT